MTTELVELAACPFCGSSAKLDTDVFTTVIQCTNDQCISRCDMGGYNDHGHKQAAITAWNTRALASRAGGWRTIDSAPRDGTMVDLWCEGRYASCRWMVSDARDTDTPEWCHLSWHTTFDDWYWIETGKSPTHWRPLHEPPAAPEPVGA